MEYSQVDFTLIKMFIIFLAIVCAAFAGAEARRIPRVRNGNNGLIENYPYQVSLDAENFHLCGGIIISEYYVLTAGHCNGPIMDRTYVRTGSSFPGRGGRLHKIIQVIPHENFTYLDESPPVDDIAIIKVDKPFIFDDTCQPIPMFEANEEATPGVTSILTGFGFLNQDDKAVQLQVAELTIVSKQDCNNIYEHELEEVHTTLPKGQICAFKNGTDSCNQDSGGPLAINGRLAGIVSWGYGDCEGSQPSVYTEIAHYRDWIKGKVGF